MAQPKPELTAQAIRLRVEERRSLRKIAEIAGASKGSLSGWLKPYPLTDEERGDKPDWVVKVPETGKIHTIQVRWVQVLQCGLPRIGLKLTEGHSIQQRYAEGDFDFIVGYDLYSDTVFI